jgi:hypothetical protein
MRFRLYLEKEGTRIYYVGYLPKGGAPVMSEEPAEACKFDSRDNAENFMASDERFSSKAGAKLEPIL